MLKLTRKVVTVDSLYHYGTKRHSGRYPYGSGENPYQHEANFSAKIKELKDQGLTEKEIATYFDMSIREFRAERSLAKNRLRAADRAQVLDYIAQGLGYSEIARKMGKPESTIRSLANKEIAKNQEVTQATIDILRKNVDDQKYIDVGSGVASSLGITETRLDTAVQALKDEGYTVQNIYVEQAWIPGKYTTVKVLAEPGTTKQDIYDNRGKIGIVNEHFSEMNGVKLDEYQPVKSISSKRVQVAYAEDGGKDKDGIIELRRGAEGLDMGTSRYAQVRIAVDGTHYLKGVAVYSDNLPDGVDIRFNTNKSKAKVANDLEAMKELKGDLSDPLTAFESAIKKGGQSGYLNIVREEGDWSTWKKSLASQMLSKQPVSIAKKQLDAARLDREAEYSEIMSLTNPTIKQYFLNQFADKCDTAAESLAAAAVPRQASHVILPLTTIKPTEIYAPNYKEGETVILIRYPHGGRFEIPELKVNNHNKEAKGIFENARDAVGIHPAVAERLSGADFDGDTVLVIPNNNRSFKTSPALKGLQGFEPKEVYSRPKGTTPVLHNTAQREMGVVTNLIADMTLRNATDDELARAVRYSMVVIDAEKHNLDYRQAKKDNDIVSLQKKYQEKPGTKKGYGGASTLITRAGAEVRIPEVKKSYKPDPETGRYIYTPTGKTYEKMKKVPDPSAKKGYSYIPTGEIIEKQTKTTGIKTVDDAYKLSSGTVMESVYADYANSMMDLAARARKEAAHIEGQKRSSDAAKVYSKEVESLNKKIEAAHAHDPLERKAQLLTDANMALVTKENPDLTKEQKSKYRSRALSDARASLGGGKPKVDVTDKEWEAIQAGAISKTKLEQVMRYSDQEALKERAMPREKKLMTDSKILRAKSRLAAGYTHAEVADMLGVSVSTLNRAVYGEGK